MKQKILKPLIYNCSRIRFVEIIGFEPMTSCMPCKRSSQLSYTPSSCKYMHECAKHWCLRRMFFERMPSANVFDYYCTTKFLQRSSHNEVPTTKFSQRSSHNVVPTTKFPQRSSNNEVLTTKFPQRSSHNAVPTTQFQQQSSHNAVPTTKFPQRSSNNAVPTTKFKYLF